MLALAPDNVKDPAPAFVIPAIDVSLIIPEKVTPPVVVIVNVRVAVPSPVAPANVKTPLLVPSPNVALPVNAIALLIVLAVELSEEIVPPLNVKVPVPIELFVTEPDPALAIKIVPAVNVVPPE